MMSMVIVTSMVVMMGVMRASLFFMIIMWAILVTTIIYGCTYGDVASGSDEFQDLPSASLASTAPMILIQSEMKVIEDTCLLNATIQSMGLMLSS